MVTRAAGRIVTSPVAFFVAGVLDLLLYGLDALRRRLKRKLGWRA